MAAIEELIQKLMRDDREITCFLPPLLEEIHFLERKYGTDYRLHP